MILSFPCFEYSIIRNTVETFRVIISVKTKRILVSLLHITSLVSLIIILSLGMN